MRWVAGLQGLYFFLTGIWPLLSIGTFQRVTGRKTDLWLVKAVGILVAVIGLAILSAAFRAQVSFEIALLAIGSALGLAAIDVVYVARRVILPIYLLDALLEGALLLLWAVTALFALA
jgi:hypothetical protein